MTGKAARVGIGPAHLNIRIAPRSWIVSPLIKWAKTNITIYAIDIKAMILVYFRESKRRKKDSGMTINLYGLD